MKSIRFSAVLLGASLLSSGLVLAGPATNKKTLHLTESIVIDGKKLEPGYYKVEWTEPGTDVQVTFTRGKDAVATFTAHVSPVNTANIEDSYSTTVNPDGSKTLRLLAFGGKKYDLDVQPVSASVGAQTADTGRQN